MRILAVSDEVDQRLCRDDLRSRTPVDLVLACGDLPLDYLGFLTETLQVPLVFVPGNHDPDLSGYRQARSGMMTRGGLPAEPPWPSGADNADGRVLDAAGIRVAGLGGCLRYRPGPNQYSQAYQSVRAARLSARASWRVRDGHRVDVLITHAPPAGVGDADDPPHRGFRAYHRLVRRMRPRFLLHGHIHPYGRPAPDRELYGATVCNVVGHRVLELEAVAAEARR
jgi:Icc-related predicted phosphoesterase